MVEDRDYDLGVCKIPRKDKDGNDITGDRIGKGGRHRKDGTYSGPVYDIQRVDDLPRPKPQVIVQREVVEVQRRPVTYEELSPGEKILVDAADKYLNKGLDYLFVKATNAFENWLEEKRRRKAEEKAAEERRVRYEAIRARMEAEERIRKEQEEDKKRQEAAKAKMDIVSKEAEPIDIAFEQYSMDMTCEEAQRELFEAFVLYLLSAKKVWKVAHANIVDDTGKYIPGQAMIDKVSRPELVRSINAILSSNPSLLDSWQSDALADMLGRSLVVNTRFEPIDQDDFRNCLMDQACA